MWTGETTDKTDATMHRIFITAAPLLLAAALFPDSIFALSERLGFETPSNFIFFVGLFCLLAIALSLSVIVSKQALMIKNLTQRLALVDHELRELRSKRL